MKRLTIQFFLPALLVLAGLAAAALLLPRQDTEPASLSAAILREQDGGAVVLHCGGQTAVVTDGDGDAQALSEFLESRNCEHIDLLIAPESYAAPQNVSVGRSVPASQIKGHSFRLSSAAVQFNARGGFTVLHGENELVFEDESSSDAVFAMDGRADSVLVHSNGSSLRLLPELSVWE